MFDLVRKPIRFPGNVNTQFWHRNAVIRSGNNGNIILLTATGCSALVDLLVNGKLVHSHQHTIGQRGSHTITLFVRLSADNAMELPRGMGAEKGVVREVGIGFFDPQIDPYIEV